MDADNPFSVFPREVRDMIYSYSIPMIPYTDATIFKTAYNPKNTPLLFLNEAIFKDAQHLLYKDHAMIIPVLNPSEYELKETKFAPIVRQCSRLMKQRSNRLMIGTSRFIAASYSPLLHINIHDGTSAEDWIYKFCGFDNPEPLARKLIDELISLRPELPNVKVIEFKFFEGFNIVVLRWKEYLLELKEAWPEIEIEIDFVPAFVSWEHVEAFLQDAQDSMEVDGVFSEDRLMELMERRYGTE
ncbi:uncharacterized protein B0J16DRAFT_326051 [Fusarium flagelliforme]|uniref:Uncharacterized protein n=1 Tax=Fusarium flagelliforme TaxID=2675880 RepID=A0A395MDP4_9HYPO|nr:uncharacterized protein B0J16DRAFT_326051 [Fusarium flagelliforme]KAH7196494.1 hypothetical protein B0J16DRAFT_326051 [Fusarium flagelliforme]RFN46042.1 hypothetical protein FIE12Z_9730 [Fusarium flagelliforme]